MNQYAACWMGPDGFYISCPHDNYRHGPGGHYCGYCNHRSGQKWEEDTLYFLPSIVLTGDFWGMSRGPVYGAKLVCSDRIPREHMKDFIGETLDGRKIAGIESFCIPYLYDGASLGVLFAPPTGTVVE